MQTFIRHLIVLPLLCLAIGCAPRITYNIETQISADGRTTRELFMYATAAPDSQQRYVNLLDHLKLPEQGYEILTQQKDTVQLRGRFLSPMQIPADFQKRTSGSSVLAKNRVTYKRTDCVLFTLYEYEEIYSDILDRQSGDAALAQLIVYLQTLGKDTLVPVLSPQYSMGNWNTFSTIEGPTLARNAYARLWEMRRAARIGITTPSERIESITYLLAVLKKLGLQITPAELPGGPRFSQQKYIDAANRQLNNRFVPRSTGVPPLTVARFQESALQQQLQNALNASGRNIPLLLLDLESKIPGIFGAFYPAQFDSHASYPRFTFENRLRVPGRVLQTNGILALDNSILWRFDEQDIALCGKTLWAKGIIPNLDSSTKLNVAGFPHTLADISITRNALYAEDGSPRSAGIDALQRAIDAANLTPLRNYSQAITDPTEQAAIHKLIQRLAALRSKVE